MKEDAVQQEMASGTWRPDKKDVQMLKKCCICPPLASVCLVMVLVMTALWICCEMIGGLVFYDKDGFRFIGLVAYVALVCVLMAGFCYCALAPKFAMRSERWKALEKRLDAEQADSRNTAQATGAMALGAASRIAVGSKNNAARAAGGAAVVTSAAATTAVATKQMRRLGAGAKAMARACGVAVPNVKGAVVAVVAVPVLVMALAFGVRYADAARSIQESQDAAGA